VVVQHSDVVPAEASDQVPSISVLLELPRIFGMNAAVVLGRDTPSRVREIELRDDDALKVPEPPVDLGFRETRSNKPKPELGLARRPYARSGLRESFPQSAAAHITHRLDLGEEVAVRSDRRPASVADQELGRSDQIVDPPQGSDLSPGTNGLFDRKPVREQASCGLTHLQPMPDDAGGPRLSRGPMRRDVYRRTIRPTRHRCADEGQRGLMTEELPWRKTRGVVDADGQKRPIRRSVEGTHPMERPADVVASQSGGGKPECDRLRHGEVGGQMCRKWRAARHPVTLT